MLKDTKDILKKIFFPIIPLRHSCPIRLVLTYEGGPIST